MQRDLFGMIRRGLRKPPHVIIRRLFDEVSAEAERFIAPRRANKFSENTLLKKLAASSINDLWARLAGREYVAYVAHCDASVLERLCPGEHDRILQAAERGQAHIVDLLGSGVVELGDRIDWQRDYKTGMRWSPAYYRDIEYTNLERSSDVKFPWELSRMQWLIPLGQAYMLNGDEHYAQTVRDILEQWIADNPYACSVNWACTMEVALRILSWSWFFHVFKHSQSWRDESFRTKFLSMLYLHGDFTERHLERSDINGNHYTADAAGLVFAGLFFGDGKDAFRWHQQGWEILTDELQKQVYADGVDFEMSSAYHRLVLELFLLPALYREKLGLEVPGKYRERLLAMVRFTEAYTQPDGSAPLWGDADDARALPFGGQSINDHRYLIGFVAVAWSRSEFMAIFSGRRDEVFWLFGPKMADELPVTGSPQNEPVSVHFPDGGCYIMRNRDDHVFIDCGPVGLAGRGGHGHNDCLSFEAVLDGCKLITDSGAYVYTASYEERNNFRSTAYHNTPQIDGGEINRFIRPDYLWNVHYDAVPTILQWETLINRDVFSGSHSGYKRQGIDIELTRTITLDRQTHTLRILDCMRGEGNHKIIIPLHLSNGVIAERLDDGGCIQLKPPSGNMFTLWWTVPESCTPSIKDSRVSNSYGVVTKSQKIEWVYEGALPVDILVILSQGLNKPEVLFGNG